MTNRFAPYQKRVALQNRRLYIAEFTQIQYNKRGVRCWKKERLNEMQQLQ